MYSLSRKYKKRITLILSLRELRMLLIMLRRATICIFLSFYITYNTNKAISQKVLLLGDSVDRFITSDWCTLQRAEEKVWGDGTIKYSHKNRESAQIMCCDGNASIAFVHLFGSMPFGPYMYVDNAQDKLANTLPRIEKALFDYFHEFGAPDMIIYQTIMWDFRPIENGLGLDLEPIKNLNSTLEIFAQNTMDRLDDVIRLGGFIFGNDTFTLGLRTMPRGTRGWKLLHALNQIVRDIARKRSLFLYDYDLDIWCGRDSTTNTTDSLKKRHVNTFRDEYHPNQHYSAIAGRKIVGQQHTLLFHQQNGATSVASRSYGDFEILDAAAAAFSLHCLDSLASTKVLLVTNSSTFLPEPADSILYTFCTHTRIVWEISLAMLPLLNLGPGDALHVDNVFITQMLISRQINFPSFFLHRWHSPVPFAIGTANGNNTWYMKTIRGCHKVTSPQLFLLFSNSSSYYAVNTVEELEILSNFLPCSLFPIDEKYSNGTLLREKKSKQVWVLVDGCRVPINSVAEFVKCGYGFSNVVVVEGDAMLDFIPVSKFSLGVSAKGKSCRP